MERRRKEQMRGEEMVERGTEERMRGGREEDRESRTGP